MTPTCVILTGRHHHIVLGFQFNTAISMGLQKELSTAILGSYSPGIATDMHLMPRVV